jgi:hypothetical protein
LRLTRTSTFGSSRREEEEEEGKGKGKGEIFPGNTEDGRDPSR